MWNFYFCDSVTGEILENKRGKVLSVDITHLYSGTVNRVIDTSKDEYPYLFSGKTGTELIPILEGAISKLGDDVDENYCRPTEGNVKRALYKLLKLSQKCPDAICHVC